MADSHEMGLTRRGFLAVGAAAGIAAANPMRVFGQSTSAPASQKAGLALKPFGRTGVKVTLVGFGAIRLQDPVVGARLLMAAVENGINLIHTSRTYGGGKSVESIGRFLEQNKGVREKIVLCVKEEPTVSEDRLDNDLKNLKTDYADAYLPQLQEPNQSMMEDAIAALDKLKKKGKIRFGGFTSHSQMNEVIELILAKAPKGYDCCLISTAMLRPADSGFKGPDEQLARFAKNLKALRAAGVGVISMKSGASGVVTKGPEAYGAHMRVMSASGVDSVATSFASVQTIETALNAGLDQLEPTAADYAAWRQYWLAEGWPCTMCGACSGACPAGLPVADLMRVSMYRDHYHMTRHAAAELAGMGVGAAMASQACQGCGGDCSKVCPVGLASATRVCDVVGQMA